jgi:hypothetical protein
VLDLLDLWILVVGVLLKGSCWLVYGTTSSISSFIQLYYKVYDLQTLWIDGEGLQVCIAWGVCIPSRYFFSGYLSHCSWQVVITVFKALVGEGICRCPNPFLFGGYIFMSRQSSNN